MLSGARKVESTTCKVPALHPADSFSISGTTHGHSEYCHVRPQNKREKFSYKVKTALLGIIFIM